jgi:dihydroorotate dehydrogenase
MKKGNYFSKPVIASSGVLGFFGEGYKHYKIINILTLGLFGYILKNWITFQSKTSTDLPNLGNAELAKDNYSLAKAMPECVQFNFWQGWMVNNFSLSGPGFEFLLYHRDWYKIKGELHLSIMLTGKTRDERRSQAFHIYYLLMHNLKNFKASQIFINWNISCPNTGHDAQADFLNSFEKEYEILSLLKLPIIVKVGWQFPISVIKKLEELEYIYGFAAINTIPFNEFVELPNNKYFPKDEKGKYISPLDKYQDNFRIKGRGGVSGNPIRPYALAWIKNARDCGVTKPIIGGGGIMNPYHVWQFKKAGATAISLGSCVSLRCFFLPFIILTAKVLFRKH